MSTLKIAILQADLHWHDAEANRALFDDSIGRLEPGTGLVVLPEMFTTGFTMDAPAQAETMDGPTMQWLADTAASRDVALCGSLVIRDGDDHFNRLVLMHPDGRHETYDKRHLFRLAGEGNHYSAGDRSPVFELGEWRIKPLVCYDLRFPVWSRRRDDADYDLLLYVANWPSPRHLAWTTLLRARAIENQCYVAGVNRCGEDGNEVPYSGGSAVIDYLGQDLVDLGDSPGIGSASLSLEDLREFRHRFPFAADADRFEVY